MGKDYKLVYPYLTSPEIGGTYCRGLCTPQKATYMIPEDNYHLVEAFLEKIFAPKPPKNKK